jgi:transposase-like protein
MALYSQERKEAILKKLLPPQNMTVAEVAISRGISTKTLYHWRDKLRKEGQPVPGKTLTSDDWSAQAKLAVVIETASETEISKYSREKGLFTEQVQRWKKECLVGFQSSVTQTKMIKSQAKADKAEIKSLKRELRYKEKALAETAALLVLRKKLNALWRTTTRRVNASSRANYIGRIDQGSNRQWCKIRHGM